MYCRKCGNPLDDGAIFCGKCGTFVEVCAEPKEENKPAVENAKVIENVTAPEGVTVMENGASYAAPQGTAVKKKKGGALKKIIIAAACLVLVAAVALSAFWFLFKGKETKRGDFAVYFKDNSIMYAVPEKDREPIEITNRLYNDSSDFGAGSFSYMSFSIAFSKDGKTAFFPEKFDEDDGSFALYYMHVDDKEPSQNLISKEVTYYWISEDGKTVCYLKANGNLYIHDIAKDESEKIDSNVDSFAANADCSLIGWLTKDDDLYYMHRGKEKEKIDGGIDEFTVADENFTVAYYIKNDNLYMFTEKDGKSKVSSDIYDVLFAYDSGEVYYLKKTDKQYKIWDYIDDDLAESDSIMQYPQYPVRWNYDSDEEYQNALDQYNAAYDEYLKKNDRDRIRKDISNSVSQYKCYELYYFDGKDETKIAEDVLATYYTDGSVQYAKDSAVLVYSTVDDADVEKIKISDVVRYGSITVTGIVDAEISKAKNLHLVVGNKKTDIDAQFNTSSVSKDAKYIYLSYYDDTYDAVYNSDVIPRDIYKAEISGNGIGKTELYMENVVNYYSISNAGIYFECESNDNDEANVAYFNDIKLGTTDNIRSYNITSKNGNIYYIDDDTLKVIENGEDDAKTIAEDVYDYTVYDSGTVVYLCNYNSSKKLGDLYGVKDGQKFKIDEDVSYLIGDVDFYFGMFIT